MRKIVSIVAILAMSLSMMAGIHTYVDNSVLNSGKWVKIRVSESGVCRMSFSELERAGLNPSELRVFGYGGAQKLQDFSKTNIDDLPQVPVYVGKDFVLFWVQGPISWSYTGSRFTHTRNTYSDYGYYFLTDNTGSMLAPTEGDVVTGTPTEITKYPYYQVHDYDSINLIDRAGVSGGGRTFYGEQFSINKPRTFTFSTPNALTDEQSTVYMELAAYSSVASNFSASVNGGNTKTINILAATDNYTRAKTGLTNIKQMSTAGQQKVKLEYQCSLASALGWLNFIEVTTPSELKMTGSWMPIRTNVNYKTSAPVRFHLTNTTENIQIWDVTDKTHIVKMPSTYENGETQWIGTQIDGIHEYVAVNPEGTNWVTVDEKETHAISNQNLHALKNIDYVIICPEGFEEESKRLAKAHEEKEAITWAVVTDQQVYNEFSSGTPDATAYRWLMKMLYDRADGNAIQKPRWLLLMGHGSFDNRKILSYSGVSLLLTYQSKNSENEVNAYCTDDYFGFLDDLEGESDTAGRMDIGVGRLPVYNLEEARTTVDKLIAYIRNENAGRWKNQIVYLADDGENGTHTITAEESAELMRLKNPDFVVNKIYLDAYPQEVNASGESYPLAKNRLDNLLKNGVLFFDYSGHGGYNAITNESIMNIRDIEKMTNRNQAFWLFATCGFAECDGGKRCSAEAAVLNPNGGAIGVFSATRTVYASPNTELNRSVTDTLFSHSTPFRYDITIGEACARGKNKLGSDANKMAYVLLGDPAIHLNYPTQYQVYTKPTAKDTLNALSVQHFEGEIIDEDNFVVEDFNGTVDITIYDKLQVIKTRDNDAEPENANELQYNDYPNTIFSGSAEVKEGKFGFTFMVPKDIRYNYGNGRIVYYASTADSLELAEAVGHYEQFTIGGTGSSFYADTVGPEMKIYLNCPDCNCKECKDTMTFKTNSTPRFFAELYDEHGINTAGAGIGHDLLMIVDDDPAQIYTLNEYFIAANSSYQKGTISYLMGAMPDGAHSLTFRAWDLLNNSTTKSLNFIVQAGIDPTIHSVTSYPNPVQATGIVNILVQYDQPDELLNAELYIYNLSGQMVYMNPRNNSEQMTVNLADINLLPGVYVYNVRLKSSGNKYSASSGKIIITK